LKTKKVYIRDGRAPIPYNEKTSQVMSANKGRDTTPEIKLRKALWKNGYQGYRLHWKKAQGHPDICYPGKKLAIFVNGCYWHRCPYCNLELPKSNTEFWEKKFSNNIARDKRNIQNLEKEDWTVLVFWECEIKKDVDECVLRVSPYLNTKANIKS
jgi:DNA mismatch endonuclease (patch repair protein)